MRLGLAWPVRLRVAWAELARGRAVGLIWGADDVKGATGCLSFARGLAERVARAQGVRAAPVWAAPGRI